MGIFACLRCFHALGIVGAPACCQTGGAFLRGCGFDLVQLLPRKNVGKSRNPEKPDPKRSEGERPDKNYSGFDGLNHRNKGEYIENHFTHNKSSRFGCRL